MTDVLQIVCPHCDSINRVPRHRLHDSANCGSCHRRLFEGRPIALDDLARFEKHASNSDVPLLVDFWAAWCGPYRAMAPVFEQAAVQLEPEARLVKVDSDAFPQLLQRFSIQGIPTLMILHRGHELARKSGLIPLSQFLSWAREHLSRVSA